MTTENDLSGAIHVQIVHALPGGYWTLELSLPAGSSVGDALQAAEPAIAAAGIVPDPGSLAVFGKTASPRTRLHGGDRIELLRPLLVNPRDARATRASTARRGREGRD